MNTLDASLTSPHWDPIELDTSRTRDRSTILRVACPRALTVTRSKLPSFMNVVGTSAEAVMVIAVLAVTLSVTIAKKPATEVGSAAADPPKPEGKFARNIF